MNLAISVTICHHPVLAIAIAILSFKSKPNRLLFLHIPATVTIHFLSKVKFLAQPYETIAVLTSEYVMHLHFQPSRNFVSSIYKSSCRLSNAPRQGPGTSHLHHPGWLNGQQDQHFHRWRWWKAWYTADHPKETCQKSQRRFNGCNFGRYDTPKSPCYVQKKDHSTLRKQSCNRTETKHKRQVILQGIISKFAHKLAPCFITLNLYQWDWSLYLLIFTKDKQF